MMLMNILVLYFSYYWFLSFGIRIKQFLPYYQFPAPNLGGTRVDDRDHFHLCTTLAGQPHPVKLHCLSSFLKFKSVSSIEAPLPVLEAQEATELVEDTERRIKNRDLAGENRLGDFARSKLIEAGVKLDRLESLLHNPPSKPALTKEDLEFRWKMLLDLQLRTRTLALCLYASTKRAGGFLVSETSGTNQKRKLLSKFDPELLTLLIPEDTTQDQVQFKKSGSLISTTLIRKVCWTFCLILGAAALLFVLVIICARLSVDLSTKKCSAVCISSQKSAPTSLRKSPGDAHFDQIIGEK
ncbi:hypothetical protein OIU84_017897 [Salix udensis]|uniref:Uncharacterized protein n=1 Tax=Salix udensis TaxID=889485 RepID=A0AAD6L320_9ROSI|nr:hypothetical protein OIU84_017897 [Salix udensis]